MLDFKRSILEIRTSASKEFWTAGHYDFFSSFVDELLNAVCKPKEEVSSFLSCTHAIMNQAKAMLEFQRVRGLSIFVVQFVSRMSVTIEFFIFLPN